MKNLRAKKTIGFKFEPKIKCAPYVDATADGVCVREFVTRADLHGAITMFDRYQYQYDNLMISILENSLDDASENFYPDECNGIDKNHLGMKRFFGAWDVPKNQAIGLICASVLPHDSTCCIHHAFVAPHRRRNRIGTRLVSSVGATMLMEGAPCTKLFLESVPFDHAMRFWKYLGFETSVKSNPFGLVEMSRSVPASARCTVCRDSAVEEYMCRSCEKVAYCTLFCKQAHERTHEKQCCLFRA